MSKEVLKLALEAMECISTADDCDFLNVRQAVQLGEAIDAIKKALEQPEERYTYGTPLLDSFTKPAPVQEPVGEVNRYGLDSHGRKWHGIYWYDPNVDVAHGTKLYTTPPAQEIVCSTGLCHYKPAAPDLQAELDATNRQVEILSDALAESRREMAALKAVQEPVGRTDQQIVDQTEELAGFLMRAFHRREKADPLSTFRGTQDIRAQHCWQTACQIQEMLTATDPENAVAELDVDDTSPAAQPAPVQELLADAWMHKDGRLTDAKAKTARVENFHGWRPMAFIDSPTSPAAQRPWVGLTDEEIDDIYEQHHNQYAECISVSFGYERAIEAKLKELNT